MEPREALFQDLQGDLHALQKQHRKALSSYEKSIRLNPNFFYSRLRKGQMEYQLDRYGPARSSLDKSLEMLPTAEAHYLLGMMDKAQGNMQAAFDHFKAAAGSDSAAPPMKSAPTRSAQVLSCSEAPARNVSAAPSTTRLPSRINR